MGKGKLLGCKCGDDNEWSRGESDTFKRKIRCRLSEKCKIVYTENRDG